MPFGQIGQLTNSYQRLRTAADSSKLESQKKSAEEVLAKFREVAADLTSLNDTSHDKLPDDPRKVVAQQSETRKPRFEKSSHQTAFQIVRYLVPGLSLVVGAKVFDKPSLSGVAEFKDQSTPVQMNAKVGPNRATGESQMDLDYQIAVDGTERYSLTTYSTTTVADAWDGGRPLGWVESVAVPKTETVEVKDGEFSYKSDELPTSERMSRAELSRLGLRVTRT